MNLSAIFKTIVAAFGGTKQPSPKLTRPGRTCDGVSKTTVSINAPHRLDQVDVEIIRDHIWTLIDDNSECAKTCKLLANVCYGSMTSGVKQTNLVLPATLDARYIKRRKGTAAKIGGTVIGTTSKWEWIYCGS